MSERPLPQRTLQVDSLQVQVYATRLDLGAAAAYDVAARMRQLLTAQERVRMVFAAAPSQNEFLATLGAIPGLDWARVEALHMDEYVGLSPQSPQGFVYFLYAHLWERVRPGRVEPINGAALDPHAECVRYSALLHGRPVDIVCAGIGENGHMAFNDPHVADFADPQWVKQVTLDEVCRVQQVHDGAFPTLEAVPRTALTLTLPALMSARWLYCIVPGLTKTVAVRRTLQDPVSTACPATIMRRQPNAILYVDRESAAQI